MKKALKEQGEDEKPHKEQENVRSSNFNLCQIKVATFLTFYFSIVGIGSSIVASEIFNYYNEDDKNKDHITFQQSVSNVSTAFLSTFLLNLLVAAIYCDYFLTLRWQKSKQKAHEQDTVFNTGVWKFMVFEILLTFIQSYPSLYGETYVETANEFAAAFEAGLDPPLDVVYFNTNDLLLCIMIFTRIHFFLRAAINVSEHK